MPIKNYAVPKVRAPLNSCDRPPTSEAQPHESQHAAAGVCVPGEEFNELKSSPLAAFANAIALTGCGGIVAGRQHSALRSHGEVQNCLDEAVENCSELIGMADLEGYFTFANRAFIQTLGYAEKEDVIGKLSVAALLASTPRHSPGRLDKRFSRTEDGAASANFPAATVPVSQSC